MPQHLPDGGPVSLPDRTVTLGWLDRGTELVHHLAGRLTGAELRGPSGLPGWTRGHLLSHLARNADALVNLTVWARTGVPTPMYASAAQRSGDIDRGATRPAAEIRDDLLAADARLARALAAMRPVDWAARVRSGKGRDIPAEQIVWLRVREVWIHAVDLDAGPPRGRADGAPRPRQSPSARSLGFGDLPAPLVDVLLDDVAGALSARPDCPAVLLSPTDRIRWWPVGPQANTPTVAAPPAAGPEPPAGTPAPSAPAPDPPTPAGTPVVTGPAASLLRWLTGRGVDATAHCSPGPLPALPAWL